LPEGDEGGGGFIAEDDDAGGFIPDEGEGGFVPDDDGAGGFLPDDGDAGGFIADDTSDPKVISTSASTPTGSRHAPKVPLTRIPALLSQLNLPADDDVLNVFRASATGWADEEGDEAGSSRRRRPNEPEEEDRDSKLGVERKDFRAVCAALLGGDEGDLPLSEDEGEDVDMEQEASNADVLGPGRRRQRPSALAPPSGSDDEDDEDGDGFEPTMSEGSSLSSLSSDSEYGASRKRSKATSTTTPKGKSKGKGKARAAGTETDASAVTTPRRKGKSKKDALVADDGPIKLNTRQKEMVRTLWEMLKPPQAEQQQGASRGRRGGGGSNPNVLGRDEVKAWVRQLGEMWTDDEVSLSTRSCELRVRMLGLVKCVLMTDHRYGLALFDAARKARSVIRRLWPSHGPWKDRMRTEYVMDP
jgi:hypothetical protein